ncbi:MAG: 7-cyano-7-deazaguanine synthase [Phycisphaeraceae bacterium]
MSGAHIAILHSGGLRSLVATALALRDTARQRITLIHVADGRRGGALRLAHCQQQARHFQIGRLRELSLPHLFGHGHGAQGDGAPMGHLAAAQMLLAGLAQARFEQAGRLVWPLSCAGDVRAAARAGEQMLLASHLGDLEPGEMPRLEAPLLEMTDAQVVELGSQLDVPWQLAWTCLASRHPACQTCPNCQRRQRAFQLAGVADPAIKK